MSEWSEDEAFWEAMAPALCAPDRLSLAQGDVSVILGCAHVPRGARVLDLGCGPGAHAIAFARLGFNVTGVDTSQRLLERARSDAQKAKAAVEWVQADMREFRRPSDFDLVCSLCMSFGYFDDEQNRRVLENVRASLTAGGVFVLDVVGREAAVRYWKQRPWQEVNGVLYLECCQPTEDWTSMTSDWVVVRGGARTEFRVRQRLYSGPELRNLLLSVGFSGVRLAGGLDAQTPYDESARRLVAIARTSGDIDLGSESRALVK